MVVNVMRLRYPSSVSLWRRSSSVVATLRHSQRQHSTHRGRLATMPSLCVNHEDHHVCPGLFLQIIPQSRQNLREKVGMYILYMDISLSLP